MFKRRTQKHTWSQYRLLNTFKSSIISPLQILQCELAFPMRLFYADQTTLANRSSACFELFMIGAPRLFGLLEIFLDFYFFIFRFLVFFLVLCVPLYTVSVLGWHFFFLFLVMLLIKRISSTSSPDTWEFVIKESQWRKVIWKKKNLTGTSVCS